MAPTNGYCTTAELKTRLGIADSTNDTALDNVITAVSRVIDEDTGRRFYAASETRYYTAEWSDMVKVHDLLSLTSLYTDEDGDRTYERTWSATDYDLEPVNAALDGKPYTRIMIAPDGLYAFPVGIRRGVKVTGSFGYTATTPAGIKEACLLMSMRVWLRQQAVFGVLGSADLGELQVIVKAERDGEYNKLIAGFVKPAGVRG